MKRIRRILGTAMVLMVFTGISVFATPMLNTEADESCTVTDELTMDQTAGEAAFFTFNEILAEDTDSGTSQYLDVLEKYAGSSIDENGNLIIYMAGDADGLVQISEELKTDGITENSLQYVYVEYSYDELKAFQEEMWEIRNDAASDENGDDAYVCANKIISVAVDPTGNCVTVLASNFTAEDYACCAEMFYGYPYEINVTTTESEPVEETTYLRPGQAISSNGAGCSFGFRCTLDGVKGFVTSLHSQNTVSGQAVKANGEKVGEIVNGVYDGAADFTFVKMTNSDYTTSLWTNTSRSYLLHATHYVVSLPIGSTVYMVGRSSTTAREGKIVYYDYAMGSGTEWLIADYESEGGDSGGCVFACVNGDYCIIGIHNGSIEEDSGSAYKKYVTKYTTMMEYYNLSIY